MIFRSAVFGFVGSIGTVFSQSSERAAFEITSAGGVTLVAKAYLSRGEMICWLTARQCGLSPRPSGTRTSRPTRHMS